MSLISKFNGNINITGDLIQEYRLKNNLSYEKLSAKLDLIGISIHKQSLYDIEHNKRLRIIWINIYFKNRFKWFNEKYK